jgi:reactive chlorine resistance protein C
MSRVVAEQAITSEVVADKSESAFGQPMAKSSLTKLAAWTNDHNVPFLITSVGMAVMLLWAGAYKMTAPGAEGIIPLVSNSPLISWQFKLFGPYTGSDLIGLTEIAAALLIIGGYLKPKAGIVGGMIATAMFFTTSTMLITTPGTTVSVHGIRYMTFLGLFLYKDVISLGVSLYLISYFGKKAITAENQGSKRWNGN